MDSEEALYTYLAANSATTGVASTRIFWGGVMPDDLDLSTTAIKLVLITEDFESYLGNNPNLVTVSFEVNAIAPTLRQAITLNKAIRTLLDGYSGPMGDETCIISHTTDTRTINRHENNNGKWTFRKCGYYEIELSYS